MIGWNGRRLLAVLALFVFLPALVYGQDAGAARLDTPPDVGGNYFRPAEPVEIPAVPISPAKYPAAHGTISLLQAISPQIVSAAGMIFSGHVTSVWRAASPVGITSASTVITFQVDQGIRGTSTGQALTIREWAGLWDRGERYRVGESVFLFLYPPSRLGLTSPVAGGSGRFELDSQRRIVMNAQNAAVFNSVLAPNSAANPAVGGRAVIPYTDFARAVVRSAVQK